MQVQTYLFFDGRCEEALGFYKTALGARPGRFMRYSDSPEPHPPGMVPPGYEDKVMFAEFEVGDSQIMAADDCTGATTGFQGFRLSLSVPDEAAARRAFTALTAGGEVDMPLSRTFFSPCFGMLRDRFGIGWMVSVPAGA